MTWSVLPIVAVWFLIPVILPVSGNNEGYDPPTVKNRICPAEFWKIVESNNNVHCYSVVTIPDDRSPIGNYLCRKLNPHAKLASFHSQAQVDAAYVDVDYIHYLTTGLTYEFDEYVWQDGTPVNYTLWATGHPSMNDSSAIVELGGDEYNNKFLRTATLTSVTRRNALCKMEAEPMQKCSQTVVSPTCESGWVQRNTYHHLSCYFTLLIGDGYALHRNAVDDDICARNVTGSYMVSIHNSDENSFIETTYRENTQIGFHIPLSKQHLPIHRDLFEWTDGTPVDYTDWDKSGDACYGECPSIDVSENCGDNATYHAYINTHTLYSGWQNLAHKVARPTLCKKVYKNCYTPSS